VREFYEGVWAGLPDDPEPWAWRRRRALLLREARPGERVLDVGCGAGPFRQSFSGHWVGLDRSIEQLRKAEGNRVLGDALRLPFPDASFAGVVALYVLYFFERPELVALEAQRVLRPGGAIAIVDLDATVPPYGDWMRADLPRYNPARAERFFERAGFSLRRVETVWRFPNRAAVEAVLRIEFSGPVAERAISETHGLALPVGYRLHVRRKEMARRG
jgi:ubiquinone/menaquinone biosynthesis C-methylase UbiE